MKILKYTHYLYLAIGVFSFYQAIIKYKTLHKDYELNILVAILAIGMFFFRRHFVNKFENRKKQ